MMEFYTHRLKLKALDETYAQRVLDYFLRNRSFLEEWDPERAEQFYTLEFQQKLLEREKKEREEKRGLRLWIFKKEDVEEKRPIGSIGFSNIIFGPFLSCNMGYRLDKDEINNGYVTEALEKGIDIMFNDYGLHRLECNIMPNNKRSLKVAEKLGFYNEGIAYKYLRINGKWEDHIHMVLRNEAIE